LVVHRDKQVKKATVPVDHTVLTKTYVESLIIKACGFTLLATRSLDTNSSDPTQKVMSLGFSGNSNSSSRFSGESNVTGDE
jgi:hypothetical protein